MEVGGGALDPENFNTVLLIQLNRLYDLNMALLASVNPAKAQQLYLLHEGGEFLCPDPAINFGLADPVES